MLLPTYEMLTRDLAPKDLVHDPQTARNSQLSQYILARQEYVLINRKHIRNVKRLFQERRLGGKGSVVAKEIPQNKTYAGSLTMTVHSP